VQAGNELEIARVAGTAVSSWRTVGAGNEALIVRPAGRIDAPPPLVTPGAGSDVETASVAGLTFALVIAVTVAARNELEIVRVGTADRVLALTVHAGNDVLTTRVAGSGFAPPATAGAGNDVEIARVSGLTFALLVVPAEAAGRETGIASAAGVTF